MHTIDSFSSSQLRAVQDQIKTGVKWSPTLEQAAHTCVSALYSALEQAIVLVRMFATVPFGELPPQNRKSAQSYARARGVENLVDDETPVLSLIGTRGIEQSWNDRRLSKNYAAIPLASAQTIEAAPMMARLFHDMGLGLAWMDRQGSGSIEKVMQGGLSGLFYVEDALTSADDQGRKIIPVRAFVSKYNVVSVFGAGAAYLGGTFVTLIVFASEHVSRETAERFLPAIHTFKGATAGLVGRRAFFESQ